MSELPEEILTLAQELQLRSLELLVDQMSPEQMRSQLIEVVRQSMVKENMYSQLLGHQWGLEPDECPQEPTEAWVTGEMSWRSPLGGNGTKILHLRAGEGDRWMPYTTSPHRIPDHQIPGGNAGWATYQFLLGAGWAIAGD